MILTDKNRVTNYDFGNARLHLITTPIGRNQVVFLELDPFGWSFARLAVVARKRIRYENKNEVIVFSKVDTTYRIAYT